MMENNELEAIHITKASDSDFRKLCIYQIINATDTNTFISKVNILEVLMVDMIRHTENLCKDMKELENPEVMKSPQKFDKLCFHAKLYVKRKQFEELYGEKRWQEVHGLLEQLATEKFSALWSQYQLSMPKNMVGTLGKQECTKKCCIEEKAKQFMGEDMLLDSEDDEEPEEAEGNDDEEDEE